jgi:hypothetical protein
MSLSFDGTSNRALGKEAYLVLTEQFEFYFQKTSPLAVILLDLSGRILHSKSKLSEESLPLLGSLLAGNLATTRELSLILDENDPCQIHSFGGKKHHVLSVLVNDETFLVVIHERNLTGHDLRDHTLTLVKFIQSAIKNNYTKVEDFPTIESNEDGVSATVETTVQDMKAALDGIFRTAAIRSEE